MTLFNPANKSYWLARLCEDNFERLAMLIPDMEFIPERAMAFAEGKPSLLLKVIDRSPYTVTLELSHSFDWGFDELLEPEVRIRVYLDARSAEVLSDHARPFVLQVFGTDRNAARILDYKWSLNYFLANWLEHCARCKYRFEFTETMEAV
jgi:uncharacterized protein YqiB (DUF1249 family)